MPVPKNTDDGVVSKARPSLSGRSELEVASQSMDEYIIAQ
jgi:hypothetical protein